MISLEEIKKYLPYYLTDAAKDSLFDELKKFPDNLDKLYSSHLVKEATIFQGDGINDLVVINLPHTDARPSPSMVFSNTCDINPTNDRYLPSRLVYAPIMRLSKYYQLIIDEIVVKGIKSQEQVDNHIATIKKQQVSQIFYLPSGSNLAEDSMVFLDRVNNCPSDYVHPDNVINSKIFTLSDYGFYVFLVKLSIHFTRIREEISRTLVPV